MNILMLTNTFTPHVGGVARSVQAFAGEFRRLGHRVLIVAPTFEGMPQGETDVVRIPAIEHFHGSSFSVPMPVPVALRAKFAEFSPQVVHSHHPFLLGDTALRVAAAWNIPVVFTHHTLYEMYTHYLPGDSAILRRFAVELAAGYSNLCNAVIAPSETIAALLRERGVHVPIEVIPTGVDLCRFARGDGVAFRARHGIPAESFVVGHVGRLTAEKNLRFLADAVAEFVRRTDGACFVVAGQGPAGQEIQSAFRRHRLSHRLHSFGILSSGELADAYRAMDVFAFASQSETQGLVLTEAMAADVPVVALDASGVRDVVRDAENGRMLAEQNVDAFAGALSWVASLSTADRDVVCRHARATAERFSISRSAARVLALYKQLAAAGPSRPPIGASQWTAVVRRIEEEWQILKNIGHAATGAVAHPRAEQGVSR